MSPTTPTPTLLGSRRASLTFAGTVFVMTLVQVLATPLTALLGGTTEWGLMYSEPVILMLLTVGSAAQAAALLLSDRMPRLALCVAIAIYLGMVLWLQVPTWLVGMYLVIALAMFLLATRSAPTVAVLWAVGASIVTVGVLLWWTLAIGTPPHVAVGYVLAEAARMVMPTIGGATLGIWWAAQVERVTLAREAAESAKREHDARVAAAEQRERARIAQELHDVAGQHLAGLVALSDAALAIAPNQPEKALSLVRDVRDEGRFAAASLAGALADLRAVGTEGHEATRDLQRANELVAYWRQRGMQVTLQIVGDLPDLPAVVSTTGYRSLQEALTNAAKHAPGAPVAVTIELDRDSLTLTVRNSGIAAGDGSAISGIDLGWGLAAMRERVELLGGSLATSSPPSGGWHLLIEIPVATAP